MPEKQDSGFLWPAQAERRLWAGLSGKPDEAKQECIDDEKYPQENHNMFDRDSAHGFADSGSF
ncbi:MULTISPECIES: hypothetical protein [unclassified Neglectibacter]|uniref:hypothetical protein n=1 Tax=unclassified Neglectibacter TaxID=2632164 RepID=UPI0014135812|nr:MULTISPECIES: hypothetical protein [unclassified Neglectibacter]